MSKMPAVPAQGTRSAAVKAWQDIPVSDPANRVTIHYHRFDEDYESAGIWTWDAYEKRSPKQNELAPVGRDEFGLVFQFDRAQYGENAGSDKIGLIPRLGRSWNRKDGGDRFWRPDLGNEIWLVSGKPEIFKEQPDVSPHVEAAFIDARDRISIKLSHALRGGEAKVSLFDGAGRLLPQARTVARGPAGPFVIELIPAEPLDVQNTAYAVSVEGYEGRAPTSPRGLLDDRALFFDGAANMGATYTPEATTFRVFAPTARGAAVVLYDEATGPAGRAVHPLQPAAQGLWETTVHAELAGKFYVYAIEAPGVAAGEETLDPYATNAVESSTRGRITNLAVANPAGWNRGKIGPRVQSAVDMVVYEMHVRDFTIAPSSGVQNRGLYLGFTEQGTTLPGDGQVKTGIDHLVELGVTHVQLLPVQDFTNDERTRHYNWGYITSAFNSPEGMFATNTADDSRIRELKALIAALHSRGIGVLLDVVYNHTGENAPFGKIVPGYYYRRGADGTLTNASGCGNDFRTEAPMARKFIVDSLKYWVREYGVDGFRFDLMALLDLTTMKEVERELRAINPGIVLYGEPWAAGDPSTREPTNKNTIRGTMIGAFNDDFRNALKGAPDGKEPGWIQNATGLEGVREGIAGRSKGWPEGPYQSLNYMTCHDNLVLWDKLKLSMPAAAEADLKAAMRLGYLALFTAQGVPFIHGGEEFARSKGGHHNSYDAPDSVNQVDWTLKKKHADLFAYVRDLIALRRAHPVFRLRTAAEVSARLKFEETGSAKTLAFTLDGNGLPGEIWKQTCVLLNSGPATEMPLPAGAWALALADRGVTASRTVSGRISVPAKSGLVLYRR